MTEADSHELIEKMKELIALVSLPEYEETDSADPIIQLLTEIVRGQKVQQEWIESLSEKLDVLIASIDSDGC
jgi:hypothetical protein